MKTSIKAILIAGTVLFAACEKETVKVEPRMVNMTITASADNETKTVLGEGGVVYWSKTGEKLTVYEKTASKIMNYASKLSSSDDEGKTMKFSVDLNEDKESESFSYYALYPNASCKGKLSDISQAPVNLPTLQEPSNNSFATNADILVAKPQIGVQSQPETLSLQFARIVALGKMTISNLDNYDDLKKITFTASNKNLSGERSVDLNNASVSENTDNGCDYVELDYSKKNLVANNLTAYFTCWPVSLATGETFTVTVETDYHKFTKECTVKNKALSFIAGRAAEFTINFENIQGESTVTPVNLEKAALTQEEIKDNTDWQGKVTHKWEYTQNNGAKWIIKAKREETTKDVILNSLEKGSYIKLPDFSTPIRFIEIELKKDSKYTQTLSVLSDKNQDKTLKDEKGDGEKTVFTFDLSDENVTTAYISTMGTCNITSITVLAGEDNRTELKAPENLKAELETKGNSIKVNWDAVENADSYEVTAKAATGEAKSINVKTTTCTFTELEYETGYTISVIAKSSDIMSYKDSKASVYANTITTGSDPMAETETFELTGTFAETESGWKLEENGVTVLWTTINNAILSSNVSNSIVLPGDTLTFSGKTICKIEITYQGRNYGAGLEVNEGELTIPTDKNGTIVWEGNSNNISITNPVNDQNTNLKFTKIVITAKE